MIASNDILGYVVGFIGMWVGYVHTQIEKRPTKDEVILRQTINDVIQKEIKEDISEIKADLKEIKDTLNDKKRNT